jgi:hypothetical protein
MEKTANRIFISTPPGRRSAFLKLKTLIHESTWCALVHI